jgi:chemotaxis protein methyltransferase CheR
LCRKGFLGIGSKESLRFSGHSASFGELVGRERIYRKLDLP